MIQLPPALQNDIEQATKVARAMITQYGMSDRFGFNGTCREPKSVSGWQKQCLTAVTLQLQKLTMKL